MKNLSIIPALTLLSSMLLHARSPEVIGEKKQVEIVAPLALGEFFDKITILVIKRENIHDPQKRVNIDKEYKLLTKIYVEKIAPSQELQDLIENLTEVNRALWMLEDLTREKERKKEFDDDFKKYVKKILQNNDTRFKIKRAINMKLNSSFIEEKSYKETLAQKIKTDVKGPTRSAQSGSIPLISIPISLADLVDRITILQIKLERIEGPEKQVNIRHEYETLSDIFKQAIEPSAELDNLYAELLEANKRAWDIHDLIRKKALIDELGEEFVELGRAVYHVNDKRVSVKNSINNLFNSALIDEKMYTPY